ncbi:MAG: arginine--tRNA ligase [Candidatus Microgenomates bacterium]
MQNPTVLITEALGRALVASGLMPISKVPDFSVAHPKDETHGDYATNLALLLAKMMGMNPSEVAKKLITSLQNDAELATLIDTSKIDVAGAGFINFWLKEEWLLGELQNAKNGKFGRSERLAGQKIMVEYTDPNPFKEMHIGHLMSNTIGEAIARLIEMRGAEVKRACYQGDVGLHVAKAVWGMMNLNPKIQSQNYKQNIDSKSQITSWIAEWGMKSLNERQKMMGQAYAYGATKYEEDGAARAEMITLNKQIYDRSNEAINALYDAGREWSLAYFETIYARFGTKFDQNCYFFESEAGPIGLKVVEEGLEKGILEIGEGGAVVYRGEKEGLHTRVFRNKLGLATYEGKELGLAKTKYQRYKYDKSYIVTANEITEYFKILISVMKQLYPELANKTVHVPHGVMKLPTGKMSSRTGKVVTGEGLLNELRDVVLAKMGDRGVKNKNEVADNVAVAALKYTVLRQQVGGDIVYEPEKMTNLEGTTGPFVQYSFVRASSILKKFKTDRKPSELSEVSNFVDSELALLRWLYRYPEVVEEAGRTLSPHMVVTYVTELAARFNTFYQNCRVEEEGRVNGFRYELVEAVANVLKSGLNTLGIVAPEEM